MKKAKRPAQAQPQGLSFQGGRPKDADILTRKRLPLWDRVKWLVVLAIVWLLLVWSLMGDNPLIGFADACRIEVQTGWWVFVLAGLEVLQESWWVVQERIIICTEIKKIMNRVMKLVG